MNEGFTEDCVSRVREALHQGMTALAEETQDRLIQAIAVPVQYIGHRVIRSLPGEPPRKETGRLTDSISIEVGIDSEDPLAHEMIVQAGSSIAYYATFLENGTTRMLPRPFMAPEREYVYDRAPDFLQSAIAAHLNS